MINIKKLSFIFAFAIILTSCDKIEPPYKQGNQQTNPETITRKVLLEDYTGHTCVNCPLAAKSAIALQESYGGKMIMLAIHAGFFAWPQGAPFNNDYRTAAGEAWDQFFAISAEGNPNGMVNRKKTGGNYVVPPGQWGTQVAAIIEDPAVLKLEIETSFNEGSRKLDIILKSTLLSAADGNYKIIACIVEDSIVSAQRNNESTVGPTPTIPDYVHRHMLRENVNGIWGEDFITAGQASASANTKNYSLTLNGNYDANNVSVVSFVYNASTYEIIQVEEKKLKN